MRISEAGNDEAGPLDRLVWAGMRRSVEGDDAVGNPHLPADAPASIDDLIDDVSNGRHSEIASSSTSWTNPLVATMPGSSSG